MERTACPRLAPYVKVGMWPPALTYNGRAVHSTYHRNLREGLDSHSRNITDHLRVLHRVARPAPMTEADHIVAVAHASLRHQTADRAARRRATEREDAIRVAAGAGISYRAIAIAADVGESRIPQIIQNTGKPSNPVGDPLGVHAVNAHYPCHRQLAKFARDESIDPGASVDKTCPTCKTTYTVTRRVIASTSRGRVDELQWEATHANQPQVPAS